MKIWLRIGKANLTYKGRFVHGMAISHDELRDALNRMGIECFDEYPDGDGRTAVRHVPDHPEEYLTMWYGDPTLWEFDEERGRGVVAYTRCCETTLDTRQGMAIKHQLNQCDVIFVASNVAKKSLSPQLLPDIHVLSGGAVPEMFPCVERDFSGRLVFLHVGAVHQRKGSDVTCKAFVEALGGKADVELRVISPGRTELFSELEERYASIPNMVFVDRIVDGRWLVCDEFYADVHCLVYPSITEGWGRCLTEAMFTGLPSICFRASAMLDQFHESCGWWLEPSGVKDGIYDLPDADDLARKMLYVYSHRNELRQKGINAHRRAIRYLTWEYGITQATPVLEKIYNGTKN